MGKHLRRRQALVLGLATAASCLSFAGPASAASDPRVNAGCGANGSVRPSTIKLTCDGYFAPRISGAHWNTWGPTTATGSGTVAVRHDGNYDGYRAKITLFGLSGAGLFTRARVTFGSHHPPGVRSKTYVIPGLLHDHIAYGRLDHETQTQSGDVFRALTTKVEVSYTFDCSNEDTDTGGYYSQGYDNFIAYIDGADEAGNAVQVALAANDVGASGSGGQYVYVPEPNYYFLDVRTGCNYSIDVFGPKHIATR